KQSQGLNAIYYFTSEKSLRLQIGNPLSTGAGKRSAANSTADTHYSNNGNVGLRGIASLGFLKGSVQDGKSVLSAVLRHPISGNPAIFIATAVAKNAKSSNFSILVAELDISPIEILRQGIRFGEGGHSAIVDALGTVVAHPNPDWMAETKNLAHLDIVKKMTSGKTGVTEFYSPFIKQQMVAGYTAVPKLGWGIMVPQPKTEIESQIKSLLFAQFGWGITGILLALLMSTMLGRWITRPLHELSIAGRRLSQEGFTQKLPAVTTHTPLEIRRLAIAFDDSINDLSISREKVDDLNKTLQNRIAEATAELRQANIKLSALARSDHLTKLANRRHFEQTIKNLTTLPDDNNETICLLLVDVDRFKNINDTYSHAAGDMVLIQIAEILERNMRQSDLSARYAGDEFVAIIHADIVIGKQRAETIRQEVAQKNYIFKNNSFSITVSIGIVDCIPNRYRNDVDAVLQKADQAMYRAKNTGRDSVTAVSM
ncbi:MAG: diguanylate cyclase, partial [Thiohalomonadales bacterium]